MSYQFTKMVEGGPSGQIETMILVVPLSLRIPGSAGAVVKLSEIAGQ